MIHSILLFIIRLGISPTWFAFIGGGLCSYWLLYPYIKKKRKISENFNTLFSIIICLAGTTAFLILSILIQINFNKYNWPK